MLAQTEQELQPAAPMSDPWMVGFNAYMDGLPLAALASDVERNGWYAANRAEAHATLPNGLSAQDIEDLAEDYEEYILDCEFWARGMW